MKIGIDIGATKIESVILKKNGDEIERSRIPCPKSYKNMSICFKYNSILST